MVLFVHFIRKMTEYKAILTINQPIVESNCQTFFLFLKSLSHDDIEHSGCITDSYLTVTIGISGLLIEVLRNPAYDIVQDCGGIADTNLAVSVGIAQ